MYRHTVRKDNVWDGSPPKMCWRKSGREKGGIAKSGDIEEASLKTEILTDGSFGPIRRLQTFLSLRIKSDTIF